MENVQKALRLEELNLVDDFLVHQALNSLPVHFEQLKVTYNNTHGRKWGTNKLITICVQQESWINPSKVESANMTSQSRHLKWRSEKHNKRKKSQNKQGRNKGSK